MALEAKFGAFLNQQRFFGRMMRSMAGGTVAVCGGIMFEGGSCDPLLQIFVAFIAKLGVRLDEQLFRLGCVRIMAAQAFAVFHRLMLHFGCRELLLRIFVALETEFA